MRGMARNLTQNWLYSTVYPQQKCYLKYKIQSFALKGHSKEILTLGFCHESSSPGALVGTVQVKRQCPRVPDPNAKPLLILGRLGG